MGCSQPTTSTTLLSPVPTSQPGVTETATIQITLTPELLPTLTTTPIPENQTRDEDIPEPIPTSETNISKITFSRYSDNDITLDYPSTWEIKKSTADYTNNELSSRDIFKQPARIVSFESEDNKTKLVVTTLDFISAGNWIVNPNIDWTRNSVTNQFPDVNGAAAVINFKYFKDDKRNIVETFDVILPKSSKWYPYSYSEKAIVTLHREYLIKFIAEDGNIENYKNIRDVVFSSISPNDIPIK
jgi:hypothetical protein